MNGETRFGILIQQTLWNCTRERFRASREHVFVVCQQAGGRLVTRSRSGIVLVAPSPRLTGVVFYDGPGAAEDAALAMEERFPGIELVGAPAYAYARAREYACRNELAKVGGAA